MVEWNKGPRADHVQEIGSRTVNCYLVYIRHTDHAYRVEETFPQNSLRLDNSQSWVIGSPLESSYEVSESIGLNQDMGGLVVRLDQCYGWFDPILWERLNSWHAQQP